MNALDQRITHSILEEINGLLERGILPIHNNHLIHLVEDGNILECLIFLKDQGLISGDMIRIGVDARPHRMTNIRLTYMGLRALRM